MKVVPQFTHVYFRSLRTNAERCLNILALHSTCCLILALILALIFKIVLVSVVEKRDDVLPGTSTGDSDYKLCILLHFVSHKEHKKICCFC